MWVCRCMQPCVWSTEGKEKNTACLFGSEKSQLILCICWIIHTFLDHSLKKKISVDLEGLSLHDT